MITDSRFLARLGRLMASTDGYHPGAPSAEAEAIDSEIASKMRCRMCGGRCHYKAHHRPGSYIALSVCTVCGFEQAF